MRLGLRELLVGQCLLSMCVGGSNGEGALPLYSEAFDKRCTGQSLPCGWSSRGGAARIDEGLFEEENALLLPAGESISFDPATTTHFPAPSTELTVVVPMYCEGDGAIAVAAELAADGDAGALRATYEGMANASGRRWEKKATILRADAVRSGTYTLETLRISNTGTTRCWLGALSLYDDWQNADAPNAC